MATGKRRMRLAVLLPSFVFGALSLGLLWTLLAGRMDSTELARGLALGLGLALAISVLCGWLLVRRAELRVDPSLVDAIDGAAHRLGPLDSPEGRHDLTGAIHRLRRITSQTEQRLSSLEGEREHLLTILGSMSDGVLVTDAEGRTVLVNRRWRQLFELKGEVAGRSALELTRQTELDRMIAEALSSNEPQQIELEITRTVRRTVILTSSPLTDGAGLVVLARDLTPFLRAGEIRRDFVANVSHELKTPLSAIRGFAETLADGAIEDPVAAPRFTERILKQCRRLEALLSDLLTLSRLEHPTTSSGWGPVDLVGIVDEAIELTAGAAADRGIELELKTHPVPAIEGDPEALMRLCINLLENAIKYNRVGGRVGVLLERRGADLLLQVSDTGIGIPPDSVERLFERFYRVDKGRSRAEGGTGLGLAIVKHAAQLHSGKIEVDSELGRGSTFRVLLPLPA